MCTAPVAISCAAAEGIYLQSAEKEIIDPFITKRLTSSLWGRVHGEAVTVITTLFLLNFFDMLHGLVTYLCSTISRTNLYLQTSLEGPILYLAATSAVL